MEKKILYFQTHPVYRKLDEGSQRMAGNAGTKVPAYVLRSQPTYDAWLPPRDV
jgi:hypothetical protein